MRPTPPQPTTGSCILFFEAVLVLERPGSQKRFQNLFGRGQALFAPRTAHDHRGDGGAASSQAGAGRRLSGSRWQRHWAHCLRWARAASGDLRLGGDGFRAESCF